MLKRLIARYCGVGSSRGGLFPYNFFAERVGREAAEWSDKGS